MTRMVQTVAGTTGYRHQLDRARRFLDRIQVPLASAVEFQDFMWAVFQNCWHIKDWVANDPLASQQQRDAVIAKAHQSPALLICRDLCNGTKHLRVDRPSCRPVGARHSHVNTTITPGTGMPSEMDCMVDDGAGQIISGKQLARDCLAEWERILQSEQLATQRLS